MKQTDPGKIREGQEILSVLKEQRGGAVLPIHKKMANDPKLLQAFSQQFKRSCMPDGVKVGSISMSPRGDLRMPSDAAVNIWMREIENL